MPILRPLPPKALKDALVSAGFDVIDETEHNWLLADANDPKAEPILVPKHGDEVTSEVMESLLGRPQRVGQAILDALRNNP